jgi:hypothetical protein
MAENLLPKISLDRIYGAGLALCPRPWPKSRTWLPRDPVTIEMLTGGMLTVAGDMPVICAASVATPAGIQLLRDAGFALPGVRTYRDNPGHDRQVSHLLQEGFKIALQHAPHPSEETPGAYWIESSLLSFLNNKRHLSLFVGPLNLPIRKLAERPLQPSSLPVVLKAATDESTGGGVDVVICRSPEDLQHAEKIFQRCRQVVAEEFLTMTRNLCLNYAIPPFGRVLYLGSAEQITDDQGKYFGNWIDEESQAPAAAIAVGMQIAKQGYKLGYRGCLGIDMALLEDGRILVFDLNFRLNGSAPALLLSESIANKYRQPAMRLTSLKSNSSYGKMIERLYLTMEKGFFLPLITCNPLATERCSNQPRAGGLVMGASREEIEERCRQMEGLGFEFSMPGKTVCPKNRGDRSARESQR